MSVTTIVGTAGNDVYYVSNVKAGDTVIYDGKGGHDAIHLLAANGLKKGNGYGDGSSIAGTVKLVSSNGGSWELEVAAMATTVNHAIVVGGGKVTGAVAGVVDYSQAKLAGLEVEVGSRTRSTAVVQESVASDYNQFQLFGIWDASVSNPTGKLDAFKGPLSFSATLTTYASTFYLNDVADAAARNVVLDNGTLGGLAAKPIQFSGFNAATFVLGSGDKTIAAKRTDQAATFVSTGGHDVVTVGDKGSIAGIARNVKFIGMGSATAATIDDSADASDRDWSIDKTRVRASGVQGDVKFYGNATLNVLTGKGKDHVAIASTNATGLTLNTGAGDDYVTVYAAAGVAKIDAGAGANDYVTFGAGLPGGLANIAAGSSAAAETVNFDDSGDAVGRTLSVGTAGLSVDGAPRFAFAAPSVYVTGGNGNDTIDAYGAAGFVGVHGGAGDDLIYGSTVESNLFGDDGNDAIVSYGTDDLVDGGAGNDKLDVTHTAGSSYAYGGAGLDVLRYETMPVAQTGIEGLVKTSSIGGSIFSDKNGNGVRDAGEKALAGTQVWLDVNHSGTFDYGDLAAFSDANGDYVIHDIDKGAYTLRVLPGYQYHATGNGATGYIFSVTSGMALGGRDYGIAPK